MCDHGHSHGGGGGSCASEVVDTAPVDGVRYDMWHYVDLDKVNVLNEVDSGSGRHLLKEWDDRADKSRWCESDADEELLINIPFTLRLFKDRDGLSFDDCQITADQEIDLKQDMTGAQDYALKAAKFNSLSHLTIHIDRNFGDDTTKVYHIGLRGEYMQDFRSKTFPETLQVVIATYEARAIPKDHKSVLPDSATSHIS